MTQTVPRRPSERSRTTEVPSHPHYTLGTLITLGLIGTLVAVGIAVAALMITAGRNSVDDALVAEKVDNLLAEAALPTGAAGDVVPDLVPKAELPLAPETEVNVAIAPEMPPVSGRTTPVIVEVSFEVVEGVTTIDPETGVEFETWGYRLAEGGDSTVTGTPGPVIRARVGDVLRFTITNPASNHQSSQCRLPCGDRSGRRSRSHHRRSRRDQDYRGAAVVSGVLHVPLRSG